MPVNCYSQRILNPFRGVMNIVSTGGADAVTIDGINWTLYIHDNFDFSMDDPEEFFKIDMPDIRFGEWNRQTGLTRSPLIASYHYAEIQAIGRVLLDAVESYADQCPFPFEDKYELWLLDKESDEPLALLDSVCNESEVYTPDDPKWESGLRCKQEFETSLPVTLSKQVTAGEILNQFINQRAGKQPAAQWFYRGQYRSGKGLQGINIPAFFYGREMSARLFPKMLVQQQWQDEIKGSLVDDFINWLSPYLLVLDFIRDEQRETLEIKAGKHAMLVEKLFPLYPKVINQKAINTARVEAMMRKSTQSNKSVNEFALDTGYI